MLLRKLAMLILTFGVSLSQKCIPKDFGYGSVVCVCNSTYCDYPDPITNDQLSSGIVRVYSSSQAGLRLEPKDLSFSDQQVPEDTVFTINRNNRYQEIMGFGGAMSDAGALNIGSLSEAAQNNILKAYFAPEGIAYTFIRVPIGGSDFSTRYYTYDDNHDGDTSLQYFALAEEDTKYKIPLIQKAIELNTLRPILLFGSSWTAPDWMKNIDGTLSSLKPEYYQLYADYYTKFLQSYKDNGLEFWAVTLQNEPGNGYYGGSGWNSMGWSAEMERDWIVANVAPTFSSNGFSDVKLMILDDQRTAVAEWTQKFYTNDSVKNLVAGTAVHWYRDNEAPASVLTDAHNNFPDKFILYTESCNLGIPRNSLGSWDKGQSYLQSIIEVLNNFVAGWVDWNLTLNLAGEPNWFNTNVDAPIVTVPDTDEFYKQPMYYALAHIAKYVPPGSVRIGMDTTDNGEFLKKVAVETPDGVTVIVILNENTVGRKISVNDPDKGTVDVQVEAKSFTTVLYK